MTMAIERRPDGVYLVGEPEKITEFSAEILENADTQLISVVDEVITLTLANGTWRYKVIGWSDPGSYVVELIEEPA